jgi:surfeit locus 1 family protein
MIFFNRRFTPSWLMAVITVAGLFLFISLGLWQLDRAAYKDDIKLRFEARLNADYRQFPAGVSASEPDWSEMEFRKLILQGQYDPGLSMLIDNRIHKGKAGYHVLTPFKLNGGDNIVLVNRGWVAVGNSREQLPQIVAPAVDGSIRGIVSIPRSDGFRMGKVSLSDEWPQVIPFVDIDAMQVQFQNQLLPMTIWLDPEQAGYYRRHWNPVWADPEKSRAYAWQWFSFAAISVVLFVGLNLRRVVNE